MSPVCPGSSPASGRIYADPRAEPMASAYRQLNDYAWLFTRRHAVYFDVDGVCVQPDEAQGVTPQTSFKFPGYSGANNQLTFALPNTDFEPGSTDFLLGRMVSSITAGSDASMICYPLERADNARFDHLVVTTTSTPKRVFPTSTYDLDDTFAATIVHEWGHIMGLRHFDRFFGVMNTTPELNSSLTGLRVVAGPGGTDRVAVKPDGDMSQGLWSLGYIRESYGKPDYGLAPGARIVTTLSDGTLTQTLGITTRTVTVPPSGDLAFSLGFTVFNHDLWRGGEIVFVAISESTSTDVVLKLQGETWFDLNSFTLPQYSDLAPFQAPVYNNPAGAPRPANLFFDLTVPIPPSRLAVLRAGMVPGVRYRVVMVISPPQGTEDSDQLDNMISTNVVLRRQ